jgi:hypothetical protein
MNTSTLIQNQLLATKFFVPVASGTLIPRPRLTTLLQESLKYPLTLIKVDPFVKTGGRAVLRATLLLFLSACFSFYGETMDVPVE